MKTKKLIITGLLFLLSTQATFAQATCKLNGEIVPCDQLPAWLWVLFGSIGFISMFLLIFWLWMLIDALKNQEKNKTLWVLLIIFTNFLGSALYYFLAKRSRADSMHDLANPHSSSNHDEVN